VTTTSTAGRSVESVLELIGNTPLLHLARFSGPDAAEIHAKLELMNPGGSVKDRLGLALIRDAERRGVLKPGGTIIEPTAGNTGIGLALVGRAKGYRVILVVPEQYSIEKQKAMKALGGELVLTSNDEGMKGAIARAQKMASEIPGAYCPQQFMNPANPAAHEDMTGPEIDEQLGGRAPDAVVVGAGTGGTFTGIVRHFRKKNPKLLGVLVEPQGSIFGGGQPGPHKVEGIGNSFWPDALDRSLVDEVQTVTDEPAFAAVRELAAKEGLLVGGSSGCNAEASRRVAKRLGPGKLVITVLPDSAERYMSKGILD
jgi:cysteine synthase A